MSENFMQKCSRVDHHEEFISGLCVCSDCCEVPQACQICNQEFHFNHIQDVKTSSQIRQVLLQKEQQISDVLKQYEEFWMKLQSKYKKFYSEIATQKLLIQDYLRKGMENQTNSQLKSLSKTIKMLQTYRPIQENVVRKNLQQMELFYQFFEDTDYVQPFIFDIKPQYDYALNPEEPFTLNPEKTQLKYNFLWPQVQPIEIYPNIDKIERQQFKFILKVLELKKNFQLTLYSGAQNESVFQINQDGILSDNNYNRKNLGCRIIKGTIITLGFTFTHQKKSVNIEIVEQNKEPMRYVYKFLEKYSLKLIIMSDQGLLQILHDLV